MIPLVITSIVGGCGAFLLIKTPAQTFLRVLPWLLLGATLLFAFGKHLTGRISAGISHDANQRSLTALRLQLLSQCTRLFRRRDRHHEPGDACRDGDD